MSEARDSSFLSYRIVLAAEGPSNKGCFEARAALSIASHNSPGQAAGGWGLGTVTVQLKISEYRAGNTSVFQAPSHAWQTKLRETTELDRGV